MRRRLCPHLPICRSASRVRGCRKTPRHASRISGRNTHITFYKGHDNVKLRFAIDSNSEPYNLSPDNFRVVYLCPLSKAVGVNGSLQSLGKTVALSLTISFSLSLSLSLSLRPLSGSLYAQTRAKAPNFIGVIKRRFIRLRSGEGKTEDARASHACAYMGFLFLLPLFLISAAAMNAA